MASGITNEPQVQAVYDPPGFDDVITPPDSPIRLVTILIEFFDQPSSHTPTFVQNEIFGPRPSMNDYWLETSYGQMQFTDHGHWNWVMAWDNPETSEDESLLSYWDSLYDLGGGKFRWWGLKSLDEAGFDFSQFDDDPEDGQIHLGDEVAVNMIDSRTMTGGSSRSISSYNDTWHWQPGNEAVWNPDEDQLTFDGVLFSGSIGIAHGGETGSGNPAYIYAHELGHAIFGFKDLYGSTTLPEKIIEFTLYGDKWGPHHIDPYQKMQVGWLTPTVVQNDGWYLIPDIETNPVAYILHDPSHGTHEYYLVENRWMGTSYDNTTQFNNEPDSNIVDEGLIVWHVDESREWNGHDSGGISKLQLVHRDGLPGNNNNTAYRNTTAFRADCDDNYDLYDSSFPENTRWWDESNSKCGIWGYSDSAKTMKAYFDVPGPGLYVPEQDLYAEAPPSEPAEYSVELISTGDTVDYVTATVVDLDDDLICSNSIELFELNPHVPKYFEFSVTKPGVCSVDPQLRNFKVNLQRVSSQVLSYQFQATFKISGVKPVVTIDPIINSGYPGDNVWYNSYISNHGNIEGDIGKVFEGITDNSLLAYPKAISKLWVMNWGWYYYDIEPCGEDERKGPFYIDIPSSWAGMEDSTYEFKVVVKSYDGLHSSDVSGWLTIKATPQSQMNYQRIKMLEEALESQNQYFTGKMQDAIGKMELAIIKYQLGQTTFTKNLLDSTINELRGLKNQINSDVGDGISEDEAATLLDLADGFISDIGSIHQGMPDRLASTPHSAYKGIPIDFDASGWVSSQPLPMQYRWDLDNDGTWDTPYSSEPTFQHAWNSDYSGIVKVGMTDGTHMFSDSVPVTIGDTTIVETLDSTGEAMEGSVVEYYENGWQSFGTTDHTGRVSSALAIGTYDFRVRLGEGGPPVPTRGQTRAVAYPNDDGNYIYTTQYVGSQSTVQFVSTEVMVELIDSNNGGLEGGISEYYDGEWKPFGTTGPDGTVSMELLPMSYQFKMTHGGNTLLKTQDIGIDPVVTFKIGAVTVQLLDSNGDGLEGGIVKYYSDGWESFGTTGPDGTVTKALPPMSYNFKMRYAKAWAYITQDVGTDPTVTFQTTLVTVKLIDSSGNGLEGGHAKYFAPGWKSFGTTDDNGEAQKELLPLSYKFKMRYEKRNSYITQDVGIDPIVIFNSKTVTVELLDSNGEGLEGGIVKYYSGGWKSFGTTGPDGKVTKALAPNSYEFKITYAKASAYITQDVGTDPIVTFQTTLVTVKLIDSNGDGLKGGTSKYFAPGWKSFGTTDDNGETQKELLPMSYKFKMRYAKKNAYITQDVGLDPTVIFQI